MFDLFLKAAGALFSGWVIIQQLDHFSAVGSSFVEGHEALPCTGYASPHIT